MATNGSGRRVEGNSAVVRRFVRGWEAHTRRRGLSGDYGMEAKKTAGGSLNLRANGVSLANYSTFHLFDEHGREAGTGEQVLVYRNTSAAGEIVAELKKRGYTKDVASPNADVWSREIGGEE